MVLNSAQRVNLGSVTGTVENVLTDFTAGPATLLNIGVLNTSGATVFLQIFDLPAADVTIGTTSPVFSVSCATGAVTHLPSVLPNGYRFGGGLSVGCTTAASNGDTATAANVNVWLG